MAQVSKRLTCGWLVLTVLTGAFGVAGSYELAVDTPTLLSGANRTPNEILLASGFVYSVDGSLPIGSGLSALHLRADGSWMIVPTHPVQFGGVDYEPRDIVVYDGVSFAGHLDGSLSGIPDYARIDSFFQDPSGRDVLSFDVPVDLGGTTYQPSDLVLHDGGVFSSYWDGSDAGIPLSSNIVGASKAAGQLVITFDVPTQLAGSEYLPGELVLWDGVGFSSFAADGSWPISTQLSGLSLLPPAAGVPDGGQVPGVPLTASLAAQEGIGEMITLSWGASCTSGANDYAIYEGPLDDDFTQHAPVTCSTGGLTTSTFASAPGDRYFLVVPLTARSEGSSGFNGDGAERAQGASACLPLSVGACQ